jgi:hypothetical protein
MDFLDGAGEIGVDLKAVEIANDEQRRVLQALAVLEQLLISGLEVFVFALVFPAELALHPHVGPTFAAVTGLHALLEGVPQSARIDLRRLGLAEQLAQVEEMLLASAAFG